MFRNRIELFRVYNIPISIDLSWLIILMLLSWTLANLYRNTVEGIDSLGYWLLGIATALAFFACIVLHELGHAIVAKKLGLPVRGITLFLFGGVAELESEPKSASDEFWMAIAGPIVSLTLAIGLWVMAAVALVSNWAAEFTVFCVYLGWINLVVLIFNLIPAFPLDGGRVLRSIIWGISGNLRRATYWASTIGFTFSWVLMGAGVLLILSGTENFVRGVWLGLIGLFLNNAAQAGYQQVIVRQVLQLEPIRKLMTPDPITVPPYITVRDWVTDYVYHFHFKGYPVVQDQNVVGLMTTEELGPIAKDEWDHVRVEEVMNQDLDQITIPFDANAFEAMKQMHQANLGRLVVMDRGQLVGIVSLRDILRVLQLRLEIEGQSAGAETNRSITSSGREASESRNQEEVQVMP
ncbi:MAG: site-2 protease family protein [Gemmataceae bacterium]